MNRDITETRLNKRLSVWRASKRVLLSLTFVKRLSAIVNTTYFVDHFQDSPQVDRSKAWSADGQTVMTRITIHHLKIRLVTSKLLEKGRPRKPHYLKTLKGPIRITLNTFFYFSMFFSAFLRESHFLEDILWKIKFVSPSLISDDHVCW